MTPILVIHGPNLNMLGNREKGHYGTTTLEQINRDLAAHGQELNVRIDAFQSNYEGEIVERIQSAPGKGYKAIIINPAAFTHTSIAIRDALLAAGLPFFEVHLSNVHSRESFRQVSLVSDLASGIVTGFGSVGYRLALSGALEKLTTSQESSQEAKN